MSFLYFEQEPIYIDEVTTEYDAPVTFPSQPGTLPADAGRPIPEVISSIRETMGDDVIITSEIIYKNGDSTIIYTVETRDGRRMIIG